MAYLRDWNELDAWRTCVVAIGNFDGVHVGHQAMITELRRSADELGTRALAMTFDPAPVELLRPAVAPPRLMRLERRIECLHAAGADGVFVAPTTRSLLELEPERFFEDLLINRLQIRGMVEGPNFRFGNDRRGDVTQLQALCRETGIALTVVEPVAIDGTMVSSSRIREFIAAGDVAAAARLLSRPHEVSGVVAHGSSRGAALGFPTANLEEIKTLLPPDGVYAGRTRVGENSYAAAVHLGPNHTFDETDRRFEVHLLDFDGDLYGQPLTVQLLERIRPSRRFDDAATLVDQLDEDCRRVRDLVAAAAIDR